MSSWSRGVSEKSDAADEDVAEVVTQRSGTSEDSVKEILGEHAFSFPKPPSLFREILRYATDQNDIILDFFAGSGTTGQAVLALNSEDDGHRRFILVSSKEATSENSARNLCRDVCAERVRRVISGYSGVAGLGGDFAYLVARSVKWDDIIYEFNAPAIWLLLQLRHDLPVRAFDPSALLQVATESRDNSEDPTLVYVPAATEAAADEFLQLALERPVAVYTHAPAILRDIVAASSIAVETVPDRLLAEFSRYSLVV